MSILPLQVVSWVSNNVGKRGVRGTLPIVKGLVKEVWGSLLRIPPPIAQQNGIGVYVFSKYYSIHAYVLMPVKNPGPESVLGFLYVTRTNLEPDAWETEESSIKPEFQGKGLGMFLYETALADKKL